MDNFIRKTDLATVEAQCAALVSQEKINNSL